MDREDVKRTKVDADRNMFGRIPEELVEYIVQLLPYQDVARCCIVDRRLYRIGRGKITWRRLLQRRFGPTARRSLTENDDFRYFQARGRYCPLIVNKICVNDDPGIYTISPDGTDKQIITEMLCTDAAWSPLGDRIGYTMQSSSGAVMVASTNVYAPIDAPCKTVTTLALGNPFYMYWREDGTRLLYLSNSDDALHATDVGAHRIGSGMGLWEADHWNGIARVPDKPTTSRLLTTGHPCFISHHNDMMLCYVGSTLYCRDLNDTQSDTVREISLPLGYSVLRLQTPQWLPFYAAQIDQPPSNATESWERMREFTPECRLALLPLANNHEQTASLAVVDVHSGAVIHEVVTLRTFSPMVRYLVSPNGRFVAYLDPAVRIAQLTPRALSGRVDDVALPFRYRTLLFEWSPNSRYLLILIETAPLCRHVVYDMQTHEYVLYNQFRPFSSLLSHLPFFCQYARSSTCWAPDSTAFVFCGAPALPQQRQQWRMDGADDEVPVAMGRDRMRYGVYVQQLCAVEQCVFIGAGSMAVWSPC
eukprot:TRINITY_DN10890_c0_g1_i2.p1 TRINITY_DN10890_c0_g1~~TRINITY_DN10890_c0_g1_i2.p1  ORF type:complete len:547 (-),score=67.45 TRINITY_DN10890_c0_g1_i2:251-1849(-)